MRAALREDGNLRKAATLFLEGFELLLGDTMKWAYARRTAEYLRQYAALIGHQGAATAAVELISKGMAVAGDDGEAVAQNELGLALKVLADLDGKLETVKAACAAYEASLSLSIRGEAFWLRVAINRAAALTLLSEHADLSSQEKDEALDEATTLLQEAITSLTGALGDDRARAQDNLGNVLMARREHATAIVAYEAARDAWGNESEQARTLANLSTAYRAAGRYDDAIAACKSALRLLTPEKTPVAWAQTNRNLGIALRHAGEHAAQADRVVAARDFFNQAIEAFEDARRTLTKEWAPVLWGRITAGLAHSCASIGDLFCNYGTKDEILIGINKIQISLFHYRDCVFYVSDRELSNIIRNYRAVESYFIDNFQRLNLQNMDSNLSLKIQLLATLDTLGVPINERAALLTELANECGGAKPEWGAGGTAVTKSHDTKSSKKGLPELPPGLAWPTETYSDSPEAKRSGGGIVAYLERVWRPLLTGVPDTIDLRTLRIVDPSAAMGVSKFKQRGHLLPSHLIFHTVSEITERQVTPQGHALLLEARQAQADASRARRRAMTLS